MKKKRHENAAQICKKRDVFFDDHCRSLLSEVLLLNSLCPLNFFERDMAENNQRLFDLISDRIVLCHAHEKLFVRRRRAVAFITRLEEDVARMVGHINFVLVPFGSTVTGFGTATSDVDIMVHLRNEYYEHVSLLALY